MSYANITFGDRNPVKRWLQRQRLVTALNLSGCTSLSTDTLCDFGAGNGELCKLLARSCPDARIMCYEPTPSLFLEAQENLAAITNIEFCTDTRNISAGTIDVVFCLEVFDHLPIEETVDALQTVHSLLRPGGIVIIGVPVEVGLPALYKGIFRMTRRYGSFDANIKNVAFSSFGMPPKNRPVSEIAPGLRFHFEHTGFDFRRFKRVMRNYFQLRHVSSSPFSSLGTLLMPEVYFVAEKALGLDAAKWG